MTHPQNLDRIRRAMSEPAFYPHDVQKVEVRETHISLVFLTGGLVYKIKKPVALGFLDFRKLADRRRFCAREVELNRRLSSGVYEGVVAIREDGNGRLSLAPRGRAVEYAVRMVQLPDQANLAAVLAEGPPTQGLLDDLGRTLAGFYASARRSEDIDAFGDPELIRFNMEENFEQIAPLAEGLVPPEQWEFVRQVCRAFWKDHRELFVQRVQAGMIRDGHGDLRADHVYFHGGVQIIDCIEFNERFRYGDAALDLAFLKMDLDRLGHPKAARSLLSIYARTSGDPGVWALVDFYAAYRALVRLKVACMSLPHADEGVRAALRRDIRGYLELAIRYALSFGRPTLWVFFGLPGSGKSTLAEMAARALSMPLLQSDAVRKEDPGFPADGVVPFNTGAYRPVVRGRVYARLLNLAQERLRQGASVVLDATFSETRWRDAAADLARDLNSGLVFVQCACSPATLRERLGRREQAPGESDARPFHLEDMLATFEPFIESLPDTHMLVDTGQGAEQCLHDILCTGHALKGRQSCRLAESLAVRDR